MREKDNRGVPAVGYQFLAETRKLPSPSLNMLPEYSAWKFSLAAALRTLDSFCRMERK